MIAHFTRFGASVCAIGGIVMQRSLVSSFKLRDTT